MLEGNRRRYCGGVASLASGSSASKAMAAERDLSVEDGVAAGVADGEEVENDRDDEEGLELGLTLGAARKSSPPPVPWGPCLRILTAKDLPSLASLAPPRSPSASSVSSSSVTNLSSGGTGMKRAAESASPHVGGSPQPPSQMVVGWPPIRAFRMNNFFNQSKDNTPETTTVASKKISASKDQSQKDQGSRRMGMRSSMFVKVKMDGDPIGRKVDLTVHHSYEALAVSLELMFQKPMMTTNLPAALDGAKALKLMDISSEFALTYEDKDGDWMLVGDVPWGMFVETAKRLRIMKISDATGLCNWPYGPKNTYVDNTCPAFHQMPHPSDCSSYGTPSRVSHYSPWRSAIQFQTPSSGHQGSPVTGPGSWNASGGSTGHSVAARPSGSFSSSPHFRPGGSQLSNHRTKRPHSNLGRGRGSNSRLNRSGGKRDDVASYFMKSMLEDPWCETQPVVGDILEPMSSPGYRRPESTSGKNNQMPETENIHKLDSNSSLAEFLAASLKETINDTD